MRESDKNHNVRLRTILITALIALLAACAQQAPAVHVMQDAHDGQGMHTQTDVVATTGSLDATTVFMAATARVIEPPATPSPPATMTTAPLATAILETPTAAPSPTSDPYSTLTIEGLAARTYGEGTLQIAETIHVTESFTRTLVHYPSDGLAIYGFMNVPFGPGPFPVALVLHGYIPPEQYGTIGYTTRYADMLARAGYLVIHPNYRNHPPSDQTAAYAAGREVADFRVGYAVDVLNLVAIVQQQAGLAGPLVKADGQEVHLLGHSMGGGIALRVITVNSDVDAAVLYGSMSGDEVKNYERILVWSNGENGVEELATSLEDMQRISPIYHLQRIQSAVSIHHGDLDDVVPPEWSVELCQLLQQSGKIVECFNYPGAPHSFHEETDRLFQQRVIDFFNRY